MASIRDLPPSASSLVLSMRDLGYSLETAVADIVDNSITAGASVVDIQCDLNVADPTLSILDDGCGMSEDELVIAMRHGGKGPRATRSDIDLGRFGLGLKTASFSQCRQLTVVSKKDGLLFGAEWDLDHVMKHDTWSISILDQCDIASVPKTNILSEQGTLVLWRKLDRLFEEDFVQTRHEIVNAKLELLRDHLSLVFHRFLSGEIGNKKLTIKVNGHKLEPFDPFCTSNKATQKLPKDTVRVAGCKVEIQPYILPHHSRLSPKEYEFYKTRSDFISNQGAYVYRNGRLMAWADWFRLVPKGEATKLGRIQIDNQSALDEAWTIDIKKSRAQPPRIVREHLRQILPQIAGKAVNVFKGRGRKLFQETESPIWERYAEQGKIRYEINQSHPIIVALMAKLDEDGQRNIVALVEAVSRSLPIDMLYSDYSSDPKSFVVKDSDEVDVLGHLRALKLLLYSDSEFDADQFVRIVQSTHLFDDKMQLVQEFIKRETD